MRRRTGSRVPAAATGPVHPLARIVLDTALADLPERERRILHCRFVDERTQAEIADLLGLTRAQISRILARVLRQLRADLSEPAPAA